MHPPTNNGPAQYSIRGRSTINEPTPNTQSLHQRRLNKEKPDSSTQPQRNGCSMYYMYYLILMFWVISHTHTHTHTHTIFCHILAQFVRVWIFNVIWIILTTFCINFTHKLWYKTLAENIRRDRDVIYDEIIYVVTFVEFSLDASRGNIPHTHTHT